MSRAVMLCCSGDASLEALRSVRKCARGSRLSGRPIQVTGIALSTTTARRLRWYRIRWAGRLGTLL